MNPKLSPKLALSPLAAAIAFAVALPAHADTFTITLVDTIEDSQEQLDDAVAFIDGAISGSHSIVFDSSLSGATLTLNSFNLYTDLTIDGEDADDLTLIMETSPSNYGIATESIALSINGVNLDLQRADEGLAAHAYAISMYDSTLFLTNTTISFSGADGHMGAILSDYGFVNIENSRIKGREGEQLSNTFALVAVDTSGVTIEHSVIEGMKSNAHHSAVHISKSEGGSSSVAIRDSIFSHNRVNDNNSAALTVEVSEGAHLSASVNRTQFFANENISGTGGGASAMYMGVRGSNGILNVTINNSSFHHNQANVSGTTLRVGAEANNSELTLNLKNTTIAENEGFGIPAILAFDYYTSTIELNMSHVTIANNRSMKSESPMYGQAAVSMFSYNENSSVNIVNSIISNNSSPNATGGVKQNDIFINSNAPIDIDSQYSLIGVERFVDDSKIVGGNNIFGVAAKLDRLCDYGSGIPTIALKAGSPAIDAASLSLTEDWDLQEDQTGTSRVEDAAPDMGAMEYVEGLTAIECFDDVGTEKPKDKKPKDEDDKPKKKKGGGGAVEYPLLAGLLSLVWLRRRG